MSTKWFNLGLKNKTFNLHFLSLKSCKIIEVVRVTNALQYCVLCHNSVYTNFLSYSLIVFQLFYLPIRWRVLQIGQLVHFCIGFISLMIFLSNWSQTILSMSHKWLHTSAVPNSGCTSLCSSASRTSID